MIRVVDLHKKFGRQEVLKGVHLELATGKVTTIVGTSGCGKTVLLKHLNALLRPDRGSVLIDGTDITKLAKEELYEMRGRFGVLFQGAALLDSMTVLDNVAFPLREKTEMSESEIRKKVEERLEQLERVFAFVKLASEAEFPNRTLTLKYRFVHVLYQNALYAGLRAAGNGRASTICPTRTSTFRKSSNPICSVWGIVPGG